MRPLRIAIASLFSLGGLPALASDIDSEHMFGFTEGSDFGGKGELELEYSLFGRLGRSHGRYSALSGGISAKYSVTDDFRIAPGFSIAHHDMSNVPGLPNRAAFTPESFELEFKYRLLRRDEHGFGLTIGAKPSFSRIDGVTGLRSSEFATSFFARLDKEIIPDTTLVALNVDYETAFGRAPGIPAWDRASSLSVSAGATTRLVGRLFVGGEARYVRATDGNFFNRFSGHALFIGPNLFYKPTDHSFISAVWNRQVAGHASGRQGPFDLDNFERNEFRVVYGVAF